MGLPQATQFKAPLFRYGFGLMTIGAGRSSRWIDSRGRLKVTSGEVHVLDSQPSWFLFTDKTGSLCLWLPRS